MQTCNTSAKLVTWVQITNGFWLAENTKETTKNQLDWSCFNNKIQENGHGFQQKTTGFNFVRKTTIEKLKKYSRSPNTVKRASFWLNVLKMRCWEENTVNKIEEKPEKLKNKLLITDYAKVKRIKSKTVATTRKPWQLHFSAI